jgi:hypothetical protein
MHNTVVQKAVRILLVILMLCSVSMLTFRLTTQAAEALEADPEYLPYRVPAPPPPVNFNPASCQNVVAWPAAAQTAFNYAVGIWAMLLDVRSSSPQTIVIDACWHTGLASSTLGQASSAELLSDFPNAPRSGTWYPVALANELAGQDLNDTTAEIVADFNSKSSWYFGLDGNTPESQYDFVTVVLHELAHGLGFGGSASIDDGVDPKECDGTAGVGCLSRPPDAYDEYVENSARQSLLNTALFPDSSAALGQELVGQNLFFHGFSTGHFYKSF